MNEFVTHLDQALDRLRRGEELAAILADEPAQAESLGDLLTTARALDVLRPVPLPAAADLAADREEFFSELAQLTAPDVSVGPLVRLNRWITQHPLPSLIPTYLFKEQRRMNTLLVKAMLVLTLVFGAASGAVVASAHSLPGDPLYPLKLGLEEANLALTGDPVQQASQWQERVRERATELAQMANQGQPVGEAELDRLQSQTQTCLQQLANLPNPAMVQQLERFQQMAQQQQQALEQAGGNQVQTAVQTMAQARQAAADGLVDPATFRYRYSLHRPDEAPPQPALTPGSGRPAATPVRPVHTPQPTGDAHRYGPQPTQPGPGQPGGNPEGQNTLTGDAHRYGPQPTQPGPGQPGGNPEATYTPTGDANRYGPQPTQPGPGQPGGNPAGQSTPTGDAHRYRPQPTQPGPGQPGGNPEATCTPTGDANRYGPQPATPQPDGDSGDAGGADNSGNSGGSGGSDNSGSSGESSDSGGSSGDTGGSGESSDSGGSDSSDSSGGSSDSGGDSGGSGGSSDSGGGDSSGGGHK